MGKLIISEDLSNKISNSLRIKQSDIDSGANKPIIRNSEPPKKDSPLKKKQDSPKHQSPIKREYYPKESSPKKQDAPIQSTQRDYIIKTTPITHSKKLNRSNKVNKLNYLKISKIVFISSIVGGIGITLGIKIGTILFL